MDVEELEPFQNLFESGLKSTPERKQLFTDSDSESEKEEISIADEDNSTDAALPIQTETDAEYVSDKEITFHSASDTAQKVHVAQNEDVDEETSGETSKPLCVFIRYYCVFYY